MPPKRGTAEVMRRLAKKYGDHIEVSFEPAAETKKVVKKENAENDNAAKLKAYLEEKKLTESKRRFLAVLKEVKQLEADDGSNSASEDAVRFVREMIDDVKKSNRKPKAKTDDAKTRKPRAKKSSAEAKKPRVKAVKIDKSAVLLKRKPQNDQFVVVSVKDVERTEHSEYTVDATFSKSTKACSMHCSCIHNQRKHKVCKHILFVVRSLFGFADEDAFKKEVGYPKTWPLGSSQWLQNSREAFDRIEQGVPRASACFHCGSEEGADVVCDADGCGLKWHDRCREILITQVGEIAAGSRTSCSEHRTSSLAKTKEQDVDQDEPAASSLYDPNEF